MFDFNHLLDITKNYMQQLDLYINKLMKIKLLLLLLVCLVSGMTYAQSINETLVRTEIEKRGYDPERFRQEMIKKGVNPESIDPNNPVDVARAQKAAEEVMAMLDAEKRTNSTPAVKTSSSSTEVQPQSKIDDVRSVDKPENLGAQSSEIQKAVKDGASIEEAVAEKLQEDAKDNLPKANTYGQHIFRDRKSVV